VERNCWKKKSVKGGERSGKQGESPADRVKSVYGSRKETRSTSTAPKSTQGTSSDGKRETSQRKKGDAREGGMSHDEGSAFLEAGGLSQGGVEELKGPKRSAASGDCATKNQGRNKGEWKNEGTTHNVELLSYDCGEKSE